MVFEFPGNLPTGNLVILHTRAAFDRCGACDAFVSNDIMAAPIRYKPSRVRVRVW